MTNASLAPTRLCYVNLFAKDIVALSQFYSDLFGFPEIADHRSPIYRCLDAGGIELGFNAEPAYELLGLGTRKSGSQDGIGVYFTIEVTSVAAVAEIAARVESHGGKVVKSPYDTYYNARQAVLEDPEGHIFRVNHRIGPRLPAAEIKAPPWDKSSNSVA